ncbi:uncharacterized protein si:dkey-229b18.3 [Hemibagrus wyckioides]|uniref:uncharacterized protein si:dkey-229b18.3 n=1 Tax=Hemibagrus wyckioides TaxID=337641 RepID=UPI00266B81E5|nr:uncharacterized protein si:dkey-229b18.3 [Hemibagrus wyckioides]
MAGECTYSARDAADDTLCPRERQEHYPGYLSGASSSSSASSSPFFETIGGFLYRKKLENGFVQYREVLDEDKRLHSIQAFHAGTPGRPHHTLEDTYRLVAEHYWWEGMYLQVRDFVLGCEECHLRQAKKAEYSNMNMSKIVKSHSHEVLSKLNNQRATGLFCDITLKTGSGHLFVAHKAVLAAVSEYFQELFTEMDSATEPQPHVDLTGFSEESLLALLEFSYTSTLTLNLGTLTEVAAMARHLRMWPALEACSALQSEQEAGQQSFKLLNPIGMPSVMPGISSMNTLRNQSSPSGRTAGFKRKREKEQGGASGPSQYSTLQSIVHIVEGTDESDREGNDQTLPAQCQSQALSNFQTEDNGFPCSPTRRMKLMDFKSPSSKRKLSPRPLSSVIPTSPSTSTRSTSPSRRLLRSTPGAALALRRLLPKIDLSSKRKRKSSSYQRIYRVKSDFSSEASRSLPSSVIPVKVKQEAEEEEVCSAIPQDEVHSPRAQEKYRLLSFLGLQRKSLVPGPEELSGWGQKKRLRKSKVSDYSLTARRKPRAQSLGGITSGLGGLMGVNSSMSLCDMTRMDLLKKVMKAEPHVTMDKKFKRKNTTAGQMEHLSVRTTRSQSMKIDSMGTYNDRPLRNRSSSPNKPLPRPVGRERVKVQGPHTHPKKITTRAKQEPQEYAISQTAPSRSGTRRSKGPTEAPCTVRVSAPKGGPPVDRSLRITTTESKRMLRYNTGRSTTDKRKGQNKSVHEKTKQTREVCKASSVRENKKNMAPRKRTEDNVTDLKGTQGWDFSNTNHQHYNNPLYKVIKEEPADPLPLTQPFVNSDVSDLGKRQSKPPVKLLDQGFLFGLCRPSGGIKREEESVDICLTRSVSHSSASHSNTSPGIVRRDRIRARITSEGSGLNGPHWAGLGNRSTSSSQRVLVRVKKEEENIDVSQQSKANKSFIPLKDSKGSCKVKKEPPKTKNVNKLYPVSSRHNVMLESIRRARFNQQKGPRGQSSGNAHVCLQCRASYRDCDGLIMHRIRHIEGKHWPCPLCSKTFFRQKNVRNHIRTHNPKLYKCRQCIASS